MFVLLTLLALVQNVQSDLLSDRMKALQVWILRTDNETEMDLAYSDAYSVNATTHTIRDVADFVGRLVAYEYDQLTTSLINFIGYNPIQFQVRWDPTTIQWINNNTVRVDRILNISTDWNVTSNNYNVIMQGFWYTDYFVFVDGTAQVLYDFGIEPLDAIAAFNIARSNLPNWYLCEYILIPACSGAFGFPNYLNDTGFANADECTAFMDALDAKNDICPYPVRSNTTVCRETHSFASINLPEIHCAHNRPNSVVCIDTCLTTCSNCTANSQCVPTFPNFLTQLHRSHLFMYANARMVTIKQVMDDVYLCTVDITYVLTLNMEHTMCTTGQCLCKQTFVQDPVTGACTCPSPNRVFWNVSNPVCIDAGRCLKGPDTANRYQCPQSWDQVKCVPYGYNPITLFNFCICNENYSGGVTYPCTCNGTEVWSNSAQGNVCIQQNQCTDVYRCTRGRTCHFRAGSSIGTCS